MTLCQELINNMCEERMHLPQIIAIDGPASSGKSTLGERLARYLGYVYLDTGVMYRAVTLAALERLGSVQNEQEVTRLAEIVQIDVRPPSAQDGRTADILMDGKDITWQIRQSDVDLNVSQASMYSGVRNAMTEQQRRIANRGKIVMVGRDIGTVVLPNAELKIYLDASVEERARRRYQETLDRDGDADYEQILASLKRRDNIDSTRELAPLKIAEDAVVINSDCMSADEVFEFVLGYVKYN